MWESLSEKHPRHVKAESRRGRVARTGFVCRTGRQCAWQYPDAKVTEFLVQSMTRLCFLSQVFPRIICQPAKLDRKSTRLNSSHVD